MPEAGTTDPSVRFFVRVAAEALVLENVAIIEAGSFTGLPVFGYLAGHTGVHVAHHVIEGVLFDAGRGQVRAAAADGLVWLRVRATQLARRADIDAAAALPADL